MSYDQTLEVTNRDAYDMNLRIVRDESIIAGPSSAMAVVGALEAIPDEPGNIVVVMFPDDVFKYASSYQRHFAQMCPPDDDGESSGESKNDKLMAEMLENLKNKHDTVRAKVLSESLQTDEKPTVIDVRIAKDYGDGHVPGSINIPQDDISDRKTELPEDRDAEIVMVCNIGKFSKYTTLYLKSLGYRNVRSMKGGMNEWVRKELPTETSAVQT